MASKIDDIKNSLYALSDEFWYNLREGYGDEFISSLSEEDETEIRHSIEVLSNLQDKVNELIYDDEEE